MSAVVAAHLPPLDVSTALRSWTPDPAGIVLVLVLGLGYALAVRRVARSGGAWPVGRTAVWLVAGVGSLGLATLSFVGAYASTLLWVHVLQVVMLLLVVPLLLALGDPASLVHAVRASRMRAPTARRVPAALRRLLTAGASPLVGPALVPLVLGLVLFSGVLPATLTSPGVADLAEVGLLAAGLLVALPLAGVGAGSSMAVALATFVGFIELLLDAIPGFLMRTRAGLLAPAWVTSVGRRWGPSPIQDQHLGGAILWGLGEALDLPFLALLVVQWIRADEREAKLVDARLDAAARAPGPVAPADDSPVQRPWWETDASVLGSARARGLQVPTRDSPDA